MLFLLQFLQEDSYLGDITDVLSLNQYAYCKGNPLRYIDPTGHSAEESQDGGSIIETILNNIFSFLNFLCDLGDNPVVPVNSKVQNEIQSQSKHLTAKMPSNFLDKIQEALAPSDSAIKAGGLILGIGLIAGSLAVSATNPLLGAMLMNAGMSTGLQVITDCLEGNKSSVQSLVTTAAISAASGAVGRMVSSLAAGMTSKFVVATVAGASASAENATLQLLATGKIDAKEVIISGAIGFGVGYLTSSIKSNPKAKLDETASLNKNAVVLDEYEANIRTVDGIIESVESGKVELTTNLQKGNYGEMKMDRYYESLGYKRISVDRVTDLNAPTRHGIDGVYYNPNASEGHKYIIAEAKFGTSRLGNTIDGEQMSLDWINGSNRFNNAVGKKMAGVIKNSTFTREVVRIKPDGSIIVKILN